MYINMSFNSTFADFPTDAPHLSAPNSSLLPLQCSTYRKSILIVTAFSITNILFILPLSALVVYVGCQRWNQQRSSSTAAATSSHSDLFTYHLLAMEIITVLGSLVYCVGAYTDAPEIMKHSLDIFSTTWGVKIYFHSLTCVERYLAVVHPVTYLGLKNQGGVRIRNISIGCVWLLCLVWTGLASLTMVNMILYFCLVALALIVVCFCSLSVLCALRRPGPGEVGGKRERVDRMKWRASHTIVTIMGILLLCLGGMLVCDALEASQMLSKIDGCLVMMSVIWFSLPSSLVLPLLFLHRAGKLPGCKHDTESR